MAVSLPGHLELVCATATSATKRLLDRWEARLELVGASRHILRRVALHWTTRERVLNQSASEFVLYEPSKSVAFGHQTRVAEARAAWRQVEHFLHERTTFLLHDHISLRCALPYSGPVTAFNAFRALANETMGTKECGEWLFSPDQLPQALNLAFEEDRWPRQPDGPAWLSFSYSFEWKEPLKFATCPLPHTSRLGVIVSGRRVFLQPTFVFPWPWDSDDIRTFLHTIEPDLPLRLREQYFKRMLPTKSGGYRVLKLSKDWFTLDKNSLDQ